jgi:hypothetical protein
VIRDQNAWRLGTSLDEDAATTLIAVASEDPNCWDDIAACWPRYRTPPVPEFADGLPIEAVDSATAHTALDQHDSWVVIDLIKKRIITGRDVEPIGRDQAFAMVVDDDGKQHCPLSVHLPPWWEMHEQTDASAIDQDRESPLAVPRVNRQVLFGQPMIEDLATRMLDVVETQPWLSSGAAQDASSRYDFTIQVHRDWLMTPRPDLGGLMPRQMLHGAHQWIEHLVWSQRIRFDDGGEVVAAPTSVSGYDDAPMGSEEMVIYFDLCRELIAAGWQWCVENEVGDRSQRERELVMFLDEVKQQWLGSPFEDGSPPRFIIECSRRRVPRGVGVPIVGMTERETEEHMIDCDCPICEMMADGMFGPSFAHLDGHYLDLDDEFAFSMHETREAWEEQQREFAEMSARIDREMAERKANSETEPNEFASAWSGQMSDGPLPGDPQGHMKLAFLLAEVVGTLQSAGAPNEDIQQLNARFTDFRHSDSAELPTAGKQLADHLEELAQRHPDLVSRVADLQSRIDEQIRCPAFDDDVPF